MELIDYETRSTLQYENEESCKESSQKSGQESSKEKVTMKAEEYNGYKVGAMKRKFKMGRADFEPGTLISKVNAQKQPTQEMPTSPVEKKVILGAM